uniref:Golgin A7 family member B n=1 Tax=Nothoprocta perdicaria TaxID=30464 RepID=A0A8C7EDC6_NOTPE
MRASLATKVFVQRDYSEGTTCQFQTKFPPELESRIERQLFEETVKTLNSFYAEAEKIGGSSYLEGCLACATAYFIFLCMETHYEKVLGPGQGLGWAWPCGLSAGATSSLHRHAVGGVWHGEGSRLLGRCW